MSQCKNAALLFCVLLLEMYKIHHVYYSELKYLLSSTPQPLRKLRGCVGSLFISLLHNVILYLIKCWKCHIDNLPSLVSK